MMLLADSWLSNGARGGHGWKHTASFYILVAVPGVATPGGVRTHPGQHELIHERCQPLFLPLFSGWS